MIDEKTLHLQLPLPHVENQLHVDVERIRHALRGIDANAQGTQETLGAEIQDRKDAIEPLATVAFVESVRDPIVLALSGHIETANAHEVTAEMIGLGNLPNAISDAVDSASSEVLATSKAVKTAYDQGTAGYNRATAAINLANTKAASVHAHTPTQVGLGNLPNAITASVGHAGNDYLATALGVKTAYDRGTQALNAANAAGGVHSSGTGWIRFTDGTQIVYIKVDTGQWTSRWLTAHFPTAFASADIYIPNTIFHLYYANSTGGFSIMPAGFTVTSSSVTFTRPFYHDNSGGETGVRMAAVIAIGRWK